jgi:hypothetical protein
MPFALLFEPDDEWKESVCVVCIFKSLSMKKAYICADGTDHCDRLTSCIGQLNSHSLFQPNS